MTLEAIGDFISSVGFPVAVAGFLLWRMNGKLERLAEAMRQLTRSMDRLRGSVHKEDER